ncbi:ImmA/IrrE family metallo-endopeptidase [Clostridium butyricum]
MHTNYCVPTGVIIKEYLEEKNISVEELANKYKIDQKYLVDLLNGKSGLTIEIANILNKALPEITASYWLNLEDKYNEYIANEKKEKSKLLSCSKEQLKELSKKFKFKEVFKGLNWSLEKQAIEMLKLLQIRSFDKFNEAYSKYKVDFFQDGGETEAIAVWINLCKEEVFVQNDDISDINYSKEQLKNNLIMFKNIAYNENLDATINNCRRLCNRLGIYFVDLDPISNSKVRGALLTYEDHPAIFISRRFKTHDHIWFAIAHEIGHLMLHYQKDDILISLEENETIDDKEEEANKFARDLFIDSEEYNKFIAKGEFTSKAIEVFAAKNRILAGMLIARLQHDGYLEMSYMNYKKIR